MHPKVDDYIASLEQWKAEHQSLRNILLTCGLQEEFKWKQPCYAFKGSNLAILGNYKGVCVLGFLKGVLLADEHNLLEKPGENSQSARLIKFKSLDEIQKNADHIKAYIFEAIEAEKAGLKVDFKTIEEHNIPEELELKMEEDKAFKQAFTSLTPGRQRGYIIHISQAKQTSTRIARIEKYQSRTLKGKGINDCVCGMSKRMPNCDGSHKQLQN